MEILVIALSVVTILALILFLYEHKLRLKQLSSKQNSPYQISAQANAAVEEAAHKATEIISQAETEALHNQSETVLANRQYLQTLDKQFVEEIAKLESNYSAKLNQLEERYRQMIENLEGEIRSSSIKRDQALDSVVESVGKNLQENLQKFLDETQKKSVQQVQLELSAARQLIDNYKNNQMRLVDENILAVLERTLALVINKNIPLDDQVDLVLEAFDRAKKEKFFIWLWKPVINLACLKTLLLTSR